MSEEELKHSRDLKQMAAKVSQIELGLETIYQLIGQLLIKSFVTSSTRGEPGLAHAFHIDKESKRVMSITEIGAFLIGFIVCFYVTFKTYNKD